MREVYFDNCATTKVSESALSTVNQYMNDIYANPSAKHRFGFNVEQEVISASKNMASILNADKSEIIWTSGATESNNLAICGYAYAHKKEGNRIITTNFEHSSVSRTMEKLESEGFDIKVLHVDKKGQIDLEELKSLLTDDTILVSIMYVNNEMGAVQDIKTIGKLIKEKNNKTVFHVDAVQAFAKYDINVKNMYIDMLSVSSHKFHGPKGVGFLYKNKNVRIMPLIQGGGQQDGLRSGTLNVPGIMGTSIAATEAYNDLQNRFNKLSNIKEKTIKELHKLNTKYDIIYINSDLSEKFAPQLISVSFKGIRSEVMLHALEDYGIYVSSGSACSSHKKDFSGTLRAIGLDDNLLDCTIRISFSIYNEEIDIDYFIETLDKILPKLLITSKK